MRRKSLSVILTLILLVSSLTLVLAEDVGSSLDNFHKIKSYQSYQFSDINSSEWYYDSLKLAFEYGLIAGTPAGTFNAVGEITIAETIALASRLNDIYYGGNGVFEQGEPWYQNYVNYAINNGMIYSDDYSSYTAVATRSQFVAIIASALPKKEFVAINNVTDIPDVSIYANYYSDLLQLYNAGIITGSDSYGNFNPNSNIQRSEVVAIIGRIVCPSERKCFILESKPIEISSITMNVSDTTLSMGKQKGLSVVFYPTAVKNYSLTWSSSNPKVATVSTNGVVTAVDCGKAIITAKTSNNKTASCEVTVISPELSDVLSPPYDSLETFKIYFPFYYWYYWGQCYLGGNFRIVYDSAEGMYLSWAAKNLSSKSIKYLTFCINYYNAVGEPEEEDIT